METILIADDQAIVRQGIRQIIESLPGNYRVIEASTCTAVLQALGAMQVQRAILDMQLEDDNLFTSITNLTDHCKKTHILVYSLSAEKVYARWLLGKGIKGFVSRWSPVDELKMAIRAMLNDEIYLSAKMKEALTIPLSVFLYRKNQILPFTCLLSILSYMNQRYGTIDYRPYTGIFRTVSGTSFDPYVYRFAFTIYPDTNIHPCDIH